MELSPSWEGDSRSSREEIPCLPWKPKAHFHAHKDLPVYPFLRQMISAHNLTGYFFKSSLIL
jgi:hypothetical protein